MSNFVIERFEKNFEKAPEYLQMKNNKDFFEDQNQEILSRLQANIGTSNTTLNQLNGALNSVNNAMVNNLMGNKTMISSLEKQMENLRLKNKPSKFTLEDYFDFWKESMKEQFYCDKCKTNAVFYMTFPGFCAFSLGSRRT